MRESVFKKQAVKKKKKQAVDDSYVVSLAPVQGLEFKNRVLKVGTIRSSSGVLMLQIQQ